MGKNQRRLAGLEEKIIALYAGGMTTRESGGGCSQTCAAVYVFAFGKSIENLICDGIHTAPLTTSS